MSSSFGNNLKLSLFGQSHGEAIGIVIDGFPAGFQIDQTIIDSDLMRRAPGNGPVSTTRSESDRPEIISGVINGRTTGQPIAVIIRNTDHRSEDYGDGPDLLRPGHADYTNHVRFSGFEDWRGGGHSSGRLTAPLVFAGSLCRQYLAGHSIHIAAHIARIYNIHDDSFSEHAPLNENDFKALRAMPLPVLRKEAASEMLQAIQTASSQGDSVGGVIECMAAGLPAGLGAPFFDGVESVLSHLLFSIPAVKAVSFGDGYALAALRGSEANDPFRLRDGRIVTETNHCGGVLGGITDGMPLVFQCCIKPTPSIAVTQNTVSMLTMTETEISVHGRHDPCIVPRAVPAVEAACAIVLMDLFKEQAAWTI